MNINHASKLGKVCSIAVILMLTGSFMATAATQAAANTSVSTVSPLPAAGGFVEFNNLVVESASSGGASAVIVAAATANSQCLSFGNNTINNQGRAIACPATSPYNLQVGSGTQLFFRGKNFAPFATFASGDIVNAFGLYDPSTSNVQVSLVRDLSKTKGSVAGDPLANLTIAKTVDNAAPQAGGIVNYTITASALGPENSTGIAVQDTLPSGVSFVHASPSAGAYSTSTGIWTIGTLATGTTATLGIQAIADASDTVGQTVVNTAAISEDASLTNNNATSSSAAFTVATSTGGTPTSTTSTADLAVTKTVDHAAPQAGATVNYTVTASDLGSSTSTGVSVNDLLPSGLTFVSATSSVGTYDGASGTWTIGTLAPSSTATLGIAARVNASDTALQVITNSATASEAAGIVDPNAANNTASAAITVASSTVIPSSTVAGLTILASADTLEPQPGATVHYTLTVSALGPSTSTGVAATDILPSGVSFVSATPSVGTYSSTTGAWAIGILAPSSTATLDIAATVNSVEAPGQTITDMATVREDQSLTNPNATQESSSVTIAVAEPIVATSTADLAVTKAVDHAAPQAGATVNYTVTATDLGPSTSTGVSVNDLLPAGLTFVSATSSVGTYNSASGMWTIGTLAPSSTATLSIAAMVNASDTVGQVITNAATASEDASIVDLNAANNTASAAITVASSTPVITTAGLEVMKTIDNAAPQAGAMVNYTITTSAMGPSTSTGVSVNDLLPSGVSFVSATPSVGTYSATSGMWTIGTLAPSSTATLRIMAMVNSSDVVGRTITNTAMATEDASLANPDSAQATASVTFTVAFPAPIVPATLSIGTDGSFLARGMIVTSVGSSSFQAQVWGNTYTVNFAGNGGNDGDEFLLRNGNTPFNFSRNGGRFSDQVVVGDIVNVSGRVTTAAPFVVTANVVRNDSIISPRQSRSFQFGSEDNGNGQFNFGTSTNGNGDNSNGNGNNSSSGSSGNNSNVSLQTQLNGLAAQLKQIEQMFESRSGQNG